MIHLEKQTTNGNQLNIDALYKLFPSCFTEAPDELGHVKRAIDWGKLRELLGDAVEDGEPEVYDFTWVGKRAARREAMAPIRKTLRPCPEESVNWDTTQNLYIEGDNLEVLKLLQNSYMGKVKMIYIDPPYNTGNDFVYHDDFHRTQREEDEEAGVFNEEGERMIKNTESNGKFHSDWCSMIYSRLMVARSLLTEDGVIFISIDDNEVENLRSICDEVFGYSNFVSQFIWKSRQNKDNRNVTGVSIDHEYIMCFSKNANYRAVKGAERKTDQYSNPDNDPRGPWTSANMAGLLSADLRPNCHYDLIDPKTGINYGKPQMGWRYDKNTMSKLIEEDRIIWPSTPEGRPRKKSFLSEITEVLPGYSSIVGTDIYTRNATKEVEDLFKCRYFDFPKPTALIKDFVDQATNKDSLILDFFSGSATTADAIMQLNSQDGGKRTFVMVQWPEETDEKSEAYKAGYRNICEIGKERIRRAGKKIKEDSPLTTQDLDIGFRVFKCDESNYKNVAFTPSDYSQESLELFVDNIKEDRSDLDLLFDCMLRWGITLDLPMTSTKVDGCKIHNVNEGALVACFEGRVTEKVIDTICAMEPNKVVFRDSSFEEAAQKMNLFELFKQKLGWEEQEVRNNIRVI